MGCMTVYGDTSVDVYINDIIDNLNQFNEDELIRLKEEIEFKIKKKSNRHNPIILESSNLEEEYKIEILNEFFDKFSWEELKEIKKKIM